MSHFLKTRDITIKILSVCFLALIFSVQFFPAINLTFYVLIFSLLGLIEGYSLKQLSNKFYRIKAALCRYNANLG